MHEKIREATRGRITTRTVTGPLSDVSRVTKPCEVFFHCVSVSVWTTKNTECSQSGFLLCWTGPHYGFATTESLLRFQALGKRRCSSTCTCTSFPYTHSKTSNKIKQTQKKTLHGTSCLMQESPSLPVICLGTAPSVQTTIVCACRLSPLYH